MHVVKLYLAAKCYGTMSSHFLIGMPYTSIQFSH